MLSKSRPWGIQSKMLSGRAYSLLIITIFIAFLPERTSLSYFQNYARMYSENLMKNMLKTPKLTRTAQ